MSGLAGRNVRNGQAKEGEAKRTEAKRPTSQRPQSHVRVDHAIARDPSGAKLGDVDTPGCQTAPGAMFPLKRH